MANRIRPRCPDCDSAMMPMFVKRRKGKSFQPVRDTFYCREDGRIARGRRKVKFL
jgi:hypothetical protein